MFEPVRDQIKEYRHLHLSPSLISLYFNTILRQIGGGLISLFGVIFFFEKLGNSIINVIILFIINYLIYASLLPLSARLLKTMRIKRMMIIATPFLVLAIFSLYLWDIQPYLFLIFYLVFVIIFKLLFWVPYHVDFAEFTQKNLRGRQMAFLFNISQVILTITPIIGGFIIFRFGYSELFFIAAIIFAVAIIPLFFVRETYEEYSFGYIETFRRLFSRKNRTFLIANVSNGVQQAIGIIIWPIFIFLLLNGEYLIVGIISSLAIVFLILIRFFVGNLLDRWGKDKVLKIGAFFYATGWIMKIFVQSGFHIFLADTYHNFGRVIDKTAFDVVFYEQAAENKHYIDEYTVLRTIALNLGRVFMLILAIPIIAFFGITATFIFAAIATLFMTVITKKVVHVEQK